MSGITANSREIDAVAAVNAATAQTDVLQNGAEFGDLWLILKRRRAWILAAALLSLLGALAYGLLTPALYTATAQILIDPRDKAVVSNDLNPATVAPDGGVTQVESQSRVIESSAVLLRAIRATGLAKDPEFGAAPSLFSFSGGSSAETDPDTGDAGRAEAGEMRAFRALKRKLAIKRADKVFIIDVIVTAQSGQKAARIANAITDAYLADQADARSDAARRASASLVARLAEQRQNVNDAENKVERYKAENNLIASNGLLIGEQQLSDLNTQLATSRGKTAEFRSRVDQIDQIKRAGARPDATAEAIGSAVVTQLREREAGLVQREAEMRTQFGPKHPAMAAIQAQIQDVHRLVATELDRIGRAARADYDRARASEASLSRSLDGLKSGSVVNQQASVKLRELERELEATRTVYGAFLLRSQETREQAGIDSSGARVITRAMPPETRSWPLMGFLLAGALGGGLGLGAGCGLVCEYAMPTLLSRSQMQRALGLPAIGVAMPAATGSRDAGGDRAAMAAGMSLGRLLQPQIPDGPRLRPGGGPAARPKIRSILLVSGSGEGGGRRLACLLARAAEIKGERVLVVDGALDASGARTPHGLQEVLRGEQSLAMLLDDDAETGVPVLGPGVCRPDSKNRNSRPQLSRLLNQAAGAYGLVIIHGGAIAGNPGIAPVIGAVDETLLVAESGKTRQRAATGTLETVRSMGGDVSAGLLLEPAADAKI